MSVVGALRRLVRDAVRYVLSIPLGTPHQRRRGFLLMRGTLSLYGNIFMWVGLWALVSNRRGVKGALHINDTCSHEYCFLIRTTTERNVVYTFLGFLMVLFTDTLYGNASFLDRMFPDSTYRSPITRVIRLFFGYIGMLVLWVGLYNLVDDVVGEYSNSIGANIIGLFLGMFLLTVSRSWCILAYIYSIEFYQEKILDYSDPWQAHAKKVTRAVVSYCGQVMMWATSWNLMLNYYGDDAGTIYPYLMLMAFGLVLLFATRTYLLVSWIDLEPEDCEPDEHEGVLYGIRVMLSITGQFLNNTGFWQVLANFVDERGHVQVHNQNNPFDQTFWKSVAYVVFGLFLMACGGTIITSIGLNEPDSSFAVRVTSSSNSAAVVTGMDNPNSRCNTMNSVNGNGNGNGNGNHTGGNLGLRTRTKSSALTELLVPLTESEDPCDEEAAHRHARMSLSSSNNSHSNSTHARTNSMQGLALENNYLAEHVA